MRVQFLQSQTTSQSAKLTVPAAALVRRGELTAVYVVNDKGYSLRAVRLGSQQGTDSVEVLSGLLEGDTVALDPVRAGAASARPAAGK